MQKYFNYYHVIHTKCKNIAVNSMDKIDVEILKILKKNSRENLATIADRLGISKATASRRIAKLESSGAISSYSLNINYSDLGIIRSLISIQIEGTFVNEVIDPIRSFPEIAAVSKVFGDYSLICEAYTRSVDELYQLIQERIVKLPNIRNVDVSIIISTEASHFTPDLDILVKNSP
jgi:transcriptional regulator, asnC family